MKFTRTELLIGILDIACFHWGCGDHSGSTIADKTVPAQSASLNVYQENASWGTIQVSWNAQTVATNLTYQHNTGPLKVQAGAATVNVTGT
jgi:hypothetical protein